MNLNSTGFNNIMEKVPQNGHFQDQKLHQNQEPLKCPRCDSSNTKFCYYNNYSLSQPRHFCKACKRYWTRGGTLRNVPVGGGCRRNKRVRKTPNSSSSSSSSAINLEANCNSNQNPVKDSISSQMGLISSGSNHMNPLFYGLPNTTNPNSEINVNFPFSRFDLEPTSQISGLGLGYDQEYKNGFHSSKQLLQDLIFPSSLGSNYTTTLGSSNTSTTPSTISSLLASKYNNFQPFLGYDEVQMKHGSGVFTKDVKMEDAQNRSIDPNQIDQMNVGSSDSSFLWNGNSFGAWVDPSNSGSSVPSLI